jgi:hypothetical protein
VLRILCALGIFDDFVAGISGGRVNGKGQNEEEGSDNDFFHRPFEFFSNKENAFFRIIKLGNPEL